MDIIKRAGCVFGAHERSRGQAVDDDGTLRSRCRHCGIAMIKARDGWQVDDEVRAAR